MDWADIVVQEVNETEKTTRPKRDVKQFVVDLTEEENEELISEGSNWSADLENSQSEKSTNDDFVEFSAQTTKRKKNNLILEEATDVEDYRFECIYCDFKTTNRKLWIAHVDYKHRSRRKRKDLDEGGKNLILYLDTALESENIESKFYEDIDLDEKITCHKDTNDLREIVLDVEEEQSEEMLESEDIEPKLHEEIDLDEKITCHEDTDELREIEVYVVEEQSGETLESEYIETKLHEEIDLDEKITSYKDTIDLREIVLDVEEEQSEETLEIDNIESKFHEEIDLDENKKATDNLQDIEIYAKDSEIMTEEVDADWADITVEESKETEDATVTKIGTSTAKFVCECCSYKTESKQHMTHHVICLHTEPQNIKWYQCDQCSYKGKLKQYLHYHIKQKHFKIVKRFSCANCPYKCKVKKHLKSHMISKHSDSEKVQWFTCDECTFRSKYKQGLLLHRRTHLPKNEIKFIKCDLCNYKTKKKSDYHSHYLSIHADDNECYWFKCGLCPYQNKVSKYTRRHVRQIHVLDEKDIIHSSIRKSDEKYKQDEYEEKSCFKIVTEGEIKRPACLFCNHVATNHKMILKHISIHHNLVKIVKK